MIAQEHLAWVLRAKLASLLATVWRFRTLRLGEWALAGCPEDLVLERRFGSQRLFLEVARSTTHRQIYLFGARAIPELEIAGSLIRPGMRVVDVGANIGYLAIYWGGLLGRGGSLVCFEPDRDNLRELRRNLHSNGMDAVSVIEAAVGAENATVRLCPGLNAAVNPGGSREVASVRLDDALEFEPDLIKIDVEGAEVDVLAGAAGCLKSARPDLFLEVHPGLLGGGQEVELVESLSTIYGNLEFYSRASEMGVAAKVAHRYLGKSPLNRHADLKSVLSALPSGSIDRAFWVVARRSRGARA